MESEDNTFTFRHEGKIYSINYANNRSIRSKWFMSIGLTWKYYTHEALMRKLVKCGIPQAKLYRRVF